MPEVAGRTTGTMRRFGPPTWFQLVISPVEKILMISSRFNDVTLIPR